LLPQPKPSFSALEKENLTHKLGDLIEKNSCLDRIGLEKLLTKFGYYVETEIELTHEETNVLSVLEKKILNQI
jgi:hypothetical protein